MASKEDFQQLKKTVQELRKGQLDILIRLEDLEDRVAALEGGEVVRGTPKQPEPILTCVQCSEEYKESENAEGGCKYHAGQLRGVGWDYKYTCCSKGSRNYDAARSITGCTKGKHCSKHHTDYFYAAYNFFMIEQSKKAKELWMTLDAEDYVTERTEWAEVGLSEEGKVFVLVGTSRIDFTAYAEFSGEELKNCKSDTTTAVDKKGDAGWAILVQVLSCNSVASGISVSIKPASSTVPLVKRVGLVFVGSAGEIPRPTTVELLSDPYPRESSTAHTVPENSSEGPVLDPGHDYSKDRKNDYETETTNGSPLILQQQGHTEVSSSSRNRDGKWNNLFTAYVKVTNAAQENLAVTNVYGEYMNKDGEWVKCDESWIGKEWFRGRYDWFEATNFSLEPASTGTLIARVAIQFSDAPPPSSYEGRRAHASLPQPLHLRVTFTDQEKRTASLRFEQGNPPLDLATRESRENSWSKKKPLEFYLFADDADNRKRTDAALFYDEKGVLCYRPAPNDQGSQYFYISSSINEAAFKAKKAGVKEYELTKMKKENKGSSACIFVLVDDTGMAYALKVSLVTPTSSATGYYLLPFDDPSKASITIEPEEVAVKGEFTVNWNVPRASKSDRIAIYQRYGKSYVGRTVSNKEGATTGSTTMKAPDAPGPYEVRYCPAWLEGSYSGSRHDGYWAATLFIVKQAA